MLRTLTSMVAGGLLAGAASAAPALCGDCRMEKFASCGGFLEGATVDATGALWVVDLLSGKVMTVADDGRCTVRGNTGGQPNGAKFGPDGQLWIADKQRGLLRMNPADGQVSVVLDSFRAEKLRGLNDLAFDKAGGLYFTEPYGSSALKTDGRLFYLPPGDKPRLQLAHAGFAFPNGLAVSADGRQVLVGEYALKRVTSVPAFGSPDDFDVAHVRVYTAGGVGPDGMLLTPGGQLIAANFGAGELLAFDAQGKPLGSIAIPGGGSMVTNVALRGGYLYATEASRGEIWRVRLLP
jgi:gluconolactonase